MALVAIRGASSLNLVERVILDSDGRLYKVTRAVPIAGQRSILWDMGTSDRRFHVTVAEAPRPSWQHVQQLVLAQLPPPTGRRLGRGACRGARCATPTN